MSDRIDEYDVHRSQIAVWIQVEYTLYGLTATTVAAALAFFKPENSQTWPLFSSALLIVLACLGCFIAFARAKIMITSALCARDFPQYADWERSLPFPFHYLHEVTTVLFYLIILFGAIGYPASASDDWWRDLTILQNIPSMIAAFVLYVIMLLLNWRSYKRDIFREHLDKLFGQPPTTSLHEKQVVHQTGTEAVPPAAPATE